MIWLLLLTAIAITAWRFRPVPYSEIQSCHVVRVMKEGR